MRIRTALLVVVAAVPVVLRAGQAAPTVPSWVVGVYRVIGDDRSLAGGLKNAGSPAAIVLSPATARPSPPIDLRTDPAKLCQPVGPFRMMARPQMVFEFVPARGTIVMLFEDVAHGLMRTVFMTRPHPAMPMPTWLGDSVGRWEGAVLVIDTVGFNDRTWFNDAGAQHSEALHLVERIRPVLNGQYLEYKITADDSKALSAPYTYTRYFERVTYEIAEDVCEEAQ